MTAVLSDAIRRKVHASFDAQALMKTFEARIDALEPGGCTLSAPVLSLATQQQGFAHAGMTFALGDSAGGYAALSVMPEESEVMTAEMKINLLAPAAGPRLIAYGKVLKAGRRLIITQSDVWSGEGETARHVATLLGTMVPVAR